MASDERESGGVQSAEVALSLLRVLAESGGSMSLSGLANAAGMPAAKVHRYIVSLTRAGFVEQNGRLGAYRLGAQALRVGLIALGRLDVMEVSVAALAELRDELDQTAMLAVWGDGGPTVVRWMDASHPVTVNVRVGSHMPVLRSATGRAFGSWLPWAQIEPFVVAELSRASPGGAAGAGPRSKAEAKALFAATRADGIARVQGDFLPGVQALAAPVFDTDDRVAAVLTVLGTLGSFEMADEGTAARALRHTACALSDRIGGRHPVVQP